MLELEKQARETAPTALLPGFEELQLRVVEGNDPAIKLYKSVGYEEFGYAARAVRYKGDYVGEYYMHKYLTEGK
jgi:RimJ/RimL family protein N-acetyltransferase